MHTQSGAFVFDHARFPCTSSRHWCWFTATCAPNLKANAKTCTHAAKHNAHTRYKPQFAHAPQGTIRTRAAGQNPHMRCISAHNAHAPDRCECRLPRNGTPTRQKLAHAHCHRRKGRKYYLHAITKSQLLDLQEYHCYQQSFTNYTIGWQPPLPPGANQVINSSIRAGSKTLTYPLPENPATNAKVVILALPKLHHSNFTTTGTTLCYTTLRTGRLRARTNVLPTFH